MNMIIIILFGIVFSFSDSVAAVSEVRIDGVLMNGEPVVPNYGDEIVISNTDSILFEYSLKPQKEGEPILYRAMLIMGNDTSVNVISGTVVRYAKLPQAKYRFEISAFDSNGKWYSKEDRIDFRVDNNLSVLLTNLNNLKLQNEELKKEIAKLRDEDNTVAMISDISLILLSVIVIILIIVYFVNRPKNRKKKVTNRREVIMSNSNERNLELENANLREELKVLRMQIDKMQQRSRNLILQNKDLQEAVNMSNKAKQELEELQEQKEELFATVVHDIKNPASIIKGLVDLLTNYDSNANDFEDIMKDISLSSSKILMLSSEISKIMALEGSELHLHLEEVDLNDIAKDVFMRNTYNAKNKHLTYECMFDSGMPNISVDILRVDEVMDNLISNAIKYTDPNGSILVETTFDKDKNHIVFSVSDTGLGLSEEDIKNTFKKGATLSSKPTAGESATGLGLWIVKKMVEAHEGYVWVKSKKGEGSTFAFSLPVKKTTKKANPVMTETEKV